MNDSISLKVSELQEKCRSTKHGLSAIRMIFIQMKLLGIEDDTIDKVISFDERTKNTWLKRYNENGIEGLEDIARPGRTKQLNENQINEIKNYITSSCQMNSEEKIVSGMQLREKIEEDFKIEYSKSGMYKFLNSIRLRKILPRPVHEKNDPEKMNIWLTDLPNIIKEIQDKNLDKNLKFYFQDETRYGQKTICTGIWANSGTSVEYKNQNGFLNSWIFGAVDPIDGDYFGLILPRLDHQNMQIFLDEFSKTISKDQQAVIILDGSQCHKTKKLKIPDNISIIILPPYSPKLNPIERLWKYLKERYLSFKRYKNIEEIVAAGENAWKKITKNIVKSVCKCGYSGTLLAKH